MNSSLSARDEALLSALSNPSTDADTVLAQLPPEDVGPWLERPEIQSAIAAAFELREIRLRFKLNAATDRAIDRMTAVFDANKDLADPTQRSETRRAASAIFRLSSRLMGIAGAAPPSPSGRSGIDRPWRSMTMRAPSTTPSTPPPTSNGSRSSHSTTLPLGHSTTSSPSALSASEVHPPGRTVNSSHGTRHSALGTRAAETPPLDTSTPHASIAGVLAAFKQLPSDAPRAALKLVERAIAEPINQQPVFKERFLTHLAASPALTCRHRPFTADPVRIDGATATQRITYTLEDGTRSAAIFRATRRDPKSWEPFPTPSWPIDCIHAADTS